MSLSVRVHLCLLRVGQLDTLIPVQDARYFHAALQTYRGRSGTLWPNAHDVFVELTDTHHAFNYLPSPRTLAFGDAVIDFLRHVLECRSRAGVAADQAAITSRL
jgi:hypothetical protein